MAKESAEEKLLKMMKKPASSVGVKPSVSSSPRPKFKFAFSIGLLNIFLFIGIILCLLALVVEFIAGSAMLGETVKAPLEAKIDSSMSDSGLPSNPSAEFYLQKISERNIFKPYVPKVVKSATKNGLAQQLARFKLVGIAWLDLPESASIMINDSQKKEMFFVKQGEQFEGITVKTIYTDRAVFSSQDEEMTIKL